MSQQTLRNFLCCRPLILGLTSLFLQKKILFSQNCNFFTLFLWWYERNTECWSLKPGLQNAMYLFCLHKKNITSLTLKVIYILWFIAYFSILWRKLFVTMKIVHSMSVEDVMRWYFDLYLILPFDNVKTLNNLF